MAAEQWNVNVHILKIDADTLRGKSKWEKGDNLKLQIEGHATVNMVKQRIALIVMAHPKHQELHFPEGTVLDDDMVKLEDIEGLADGKTLFVKCEVPPEKEAPPVVLSDDEGLVKEEDAPLPELPSKEVMAKELDDADMDKQCALKQEAQDAVEDGDMTKAVAKFSEAMMLGGVSAMMLSKRAEMLLKQKRYRAAIVDATAALEMNPDSAKGYRVRGKARRFIGEYDGSSADFSQAQTIDYDDGVAEVHSYVKRRWERMQTKVKQDAKAAEKAEKAAKEAGYPA